MRADMTLDRLHNVIQIAMGWTNSHMHQFIAGSGFARTYYGRPDPEFADIGTETLNERRHTVADLAPVAKRSGITEHPPSLKLRRTSRAAGGQCGSHPAEHRRMWS